MQHRLAGEGWEKTGLFYAICTCGYSVVGGTVEWVDVQMAQHRHPSGRGRA